MRLLHYYVAWGCEHLPPLGGGALSRRAASWASTAHTLWGMCHYGCTTWAWTLPAGAPTRWAGSGGRSGVWGGAGRGCRPLPACWEITCGVNSACPHSPQDTMQRSTDDVRLAWWPCRISWEGQADGTALFSVCSTSILEQAAWLERSSTRSTRPASGQREYRAPKDGPCIRCTCSSYMRNPSTLSR